MLEKLYGLIRVFLFNAPVVSDINLAEYLIANGVTFQRWIPVTERLPEETDYYLYLANSPYRGLKDGVGVSFYMHKAKKWKGTNNDYVTHWMPLPEGPKED